MQIIGHTPDEIGEAVFDSPAKTVSKNFPIELVVSAQGSRSDRNEVPAHAGDAQRDRDMVTDLFARTADQDRYAAGAPWPLRHLPDG